MTISTFLFDFGGVLYTPLDPQVVLQQRILSAEKLGFDSFQNMWDYLYKGDAWQLAKTGVISDEEMWSLLLTPLGMTERDQRVDFVNQLFSGVGLLPEMNDLLSSLHSKYKLAILSNATDILERLLEEELKIAHYFEIIVNSHRIGFAKPDPAAFRLTLALLDEPAANVLFIDDQENNLEAANDLGFHTYFFNTVSNLRRDLVRRELIS